MGIRSSLVVALTLIGSLVGGAAPSSASDATFTEWPTYHLDAVRSGNDTTEPPIGTLAKKWTMTLDGAVYAEPLMVGGRVIVATENDSIYALDPTTGSQLWKRTVGTPVPLSQLPCGDIDPLGITGTPAYDAATGRVFVVAEQLTNQQTVRHVLFALDPATGTVLASRNVDPKNINPTVEQQRPGLAVGNGYVYVAFGGLAGDCGNYHGIVVAVPLSLDGNIHVYNPTKYEPSAVQAGIWATPGPSIDADGNVFVSVGNGRTSDPYDFSDSVLKLTPKVRLRTYFAPTTWKSDNIADADLGSQGPALVGQYIFQAGKSGTGYLIKQTHLGHIGGQIDSASVCQSFGGTAVTGNTVYVPCTDGIRAVSVAGGQIAILWHAAATAAKGPPVLGGGAVWSVAWGAGTLYALNPTSGATLSSIAIGSVPHFATPMLSGGIAFIGTLTGVVAISGV